jgi:hypothetical protein
VAVLPGGTSPTPLDITLHPSVIWPRPLDLPESAAIVPTLDVVMAAAHFHQPVVEPQSPGSVDVLADEGRGGNTHALALAISKPVDTPVGATEPEISLTRPTPPNAATSARRTASALVVRRG